MGIRFLCPNGHKLNVKSFLAGKRGICPHCGTRLRIPTESQLPSRREQAAGDGASAGPARNRSVLKLPKPMAAAPQDSGIAISTLDPLSPSVHPEVETATDVHPAVAAESAADGSGLGLPHITTDPTPPAAPASPSSAPDPISEAPQAVWYVRPPSGGQYGPAPGAIMRQWISEGRVSADSLVWREGWSDWQSAGGVFPQLGSASAGAIAAVNGPNGSPATDARPQLARDQKERRRRHAASIAVIGLAAVSVFLLVLLLYVILR